MRVSAWDVSILLRFINKVKNIIKLILLKWNWPNSYIVFPISLFWSQLLSWRCPKSKAPCSPSSTSFDQTAVILCNKVITFIEFSAVKFNYDEKHLSKLLMAKHIIFSSRITCAYWLQAHFLMYVSFICTKIWKFRTPTTKEYPILLLKYTFPFL